MQNALLFSVAVMLRPFPVGHEKWYLYSFEALYVERGLDWPCAAIEERYVIIGDGRDSRARETWFIGFVPRLVVCI